MPAKTKKNRKPEKNRSGAFRIIAGTHRSRRLSFVEVEGLRPTTDRVRETLFNWLQQSMPGARVLDLFAGSGALGLEAASRDAAFVQLVEINSAAASMIQSHIKTLGLDAAVAQKDALQFLEAFDGEGFDVVFIDPPFRKDMLNAVLEQLGRSSVLKPNAYVYIEAEAELKAFTPPDYLQEVRSKQAGQVAFTLYRKRPD